MSLPEHPEPSLVEYRPLCGWAIAALLIGLGSAVAVIHPLLWVVPLAGIVMAAVALVQLQRSQTPLLGRTPALLGLTLSLIFAAAAPAHMLSRNYWLTSRAERAGDEFFAQLKAGHPEQAFELTLRASEKGRSPRHGPEEPTAPPSGDDKTAQKPVVRTALEEFLAERPVSTLVAMGNRLNARHVRTDIMPSELLRQEVAVRYEVSGGEANRAKPMAVVLFVRQMIDAGLPERWVITNVTTPPSTASD
jgi:hypothetical protein